MSEAKAQGLNKQESRFLLLTITIFIAACLETDIYLPAFPDMMIYYDTTEEMIQRLLGWNFLGICLSGPFYGPISDAIGRRWPTLVALGFFVLGSLLTLFADTFSWMLFCQGSSGNRWRWLLHTWGNGPFRSFYRRKSRCCSVKNQYDRACDHGRCSYARWASQ